MTTRNTRPLEPVRHALLGLHQSLLAAERITWESMHGRVPGNAEFLQLILHDPWFLWLRPMTALIAAMDESIIDQDQDAHERLPTLLRTARGLLHPDDNGGDFQQRYFDLVQRFPDVAVAHGRFIKALQDAMP